MFLNGTWKYTYNFRESFSRYTRVVFYKLKYGVNRFSRTFLTTFLTTLLTTFLTTLFCNVISTNIKTFYSINIKHWQSKYKTIPRGGEGRFHSLCVAIMSFIRRDYLFETRTTTLHILQAAENVGKHRIATTRSHTHYIHIFDRTTIFVYFGYILTTHVYLR